MQIVYNLVMTDTESSYDDHTEEFNIGYFSGRSAAEKTASRYLSGVKGFKDYTVTYRITEKNMIGASDDPIPPEIYIIFGWNLNDESDEVDVIESDCCSSMDEAEKQLNIMRSEYDREEWCIDRYRIDECCWQEGFEKIYR